MNVKRLKGVTDKPVCVGFGISNANQARRVARLADGIILGSSVIKVMERNVGSAKLYKRVTDFVNSIGKAI